MTTTELYQWRQFRLHRLQAKARKGLQDAIAKAEADHKEALRALDAFERMPAHLMRFSPVSFEQTGNGPVATFDGSFAQEALDILSHVKLSSLKLTMHGRPWFVPADSLEGCAATNKRIKSKTVVEISNGLAGTPQQTCILAWWNDEKIGHIALRINLLDAPIVFTGCAYPSHTSSWAQESWPDVWSPTPKTDTLWYAYHK